MILENFSPTRSQQKFFDYFPLQLNPPNPVDHRCIELHGDIGCGTSTCAAIWLLLQSYWYPERKGLIFCKEFILSDFMVTVNLWENYLENYLKSNWHSADCDKSLLTGDRFDYIVVDQAGYLSAKDFDSIDRELSDRGQILVTVGSEKSDDFFQWSVKTRSLVIDINFGENSWDIE